MLKRLSVLAILFFSSLSFSIDLSVHDTTFSNGLRLLVVPDNSTPIVSCRLYYFMGSYYETAGTTGLSHLYEHMMFKGTKRLGTKDYKSEKIYMAKIDSIDNEIVKMKESGIVEEDSLIIKKRAEIFTLLDKQREFIIKDEIWSLYQKNGATTLNAWTSDDITAYIVSLPSNKVELFANIESDRMENLVLREFYSERDVVTEEWRMRYKNRPENMYFSRLEALFYTANPYRNPTIGWYSDIRNYTRSKLKDHINKFYRPDNALLVLAGDIDTNYADSIVGKYFGKIKKPKSSIPKVVTTEPAPIGVSRLEVVSEGTPRVDIIFHTPGYPDSALFALDVVEGMFSGKSGILYKSLVEDLKLCNSISASNRWRQKNGEFMVSATLKDGVDPKVVENRILDIIEIYSTVEPTESELGRIKNGLKYYFIKELQNSESLSDQLAYFEKLGSWRDMLTYEDRIGKIKNTAWAVKQFLLPEFRTVGYLVNEKEKK